MRIANHLEQTVIEVTDQDFYDAMDMPGEADPEYRRVQGIIDDLLVSKNIRNLIENSIHDMLAEIRGRVWVEVRKQWAAETRKLR